MNNAIESRSRIPKSLSRVALAGTLAAFGAQEVSASAQPPAEVAPQAICYMYKEQTPEDLRGVFERSGERIVEEGVLYQVIEERSLRPVRRVLLEEADNDRALRFYEEPCTISSSEV